MLPCLQNILYMLLIHLHITVCYLIFVLMTVLLQLASIFCKFLTHLIVNCTLAWVELFMIISTQATIKIRKKQGKWSWHFQLISPLIIWKFTVIYLVNLIDFPIFYGFLFGLSLSMLCVTVYHNLMKWSCSYFQLYVNK